MHKRLKFLLINPTAPEWRVTSGKGPLKKTQIFRYSMLSSLYVAAAMPASVETRIVDEEVEAIDFDTDADLIGISFMTFNAPRAYEIADEFRNHRSKPVIVGGYHPSFMPEEVLGHADAVCIGEAENNVPRMIEDFMAGRLSRIYRNGTVDLKGLPVPDRGLIKQGSYSVVDTVQATRGCPQRCTFCSISTFFGQKFRSRPVDEVIEELKQLGKYLLFMDDNIISDADYAKDLFEKMIPLGKIWFSQCSTRVAYNDELLSLARRSGCRGLFVGFESLSQDGLKDWNKSFNRAKDYAWVIKQIHLKGISVCAAIVFGNDSDTPEIFPRTLEFLLTSNVDVLQATILTPFPGTPLFDEMDREGRIVDKNWGHYDFRHVVFEPHRMGREVLKDGHDWVLSKFYSRQSIARRLRNELAYLNPNTMLRATLPLNISYRSRLSADGTF
ncbi:MAG: radical SAM protein [bacterium]